MTQNQKSRLLGWMGWAGLDALGRLCLLTVSTIILSRMLPAQQFGVAALVLALVAMASLFVGAPFEEALAQRKVVRKVHLQAAMGVSLLIGVILFGLTCLLSQPLAKLYGEEQIAILLPLCMLSIFFSGHADIMTALARRLRRFNDLARANLLSNAIGIVLSLGIAALGYGAIALVAQRLLIMVAKDVLLQRALGHPILPRWLPSCLSDMWRFSSVSFLSRLLENTTYLIFNNLVQVLYGVATLGQVNMAMRLIEPVRGAVLATGHNLAFAFFTKVGHDRERLRLMAGSAASWSAFVTVPVFAGIAAVAPVLMPIVAGPGWEAAISVLIGLAIASAIGVPASMIFTAFSADAQPQYGLNSLLAGLAAMIVVLVGCASLGPVSVGLSRIASDGVRALFAIGIASSRLQWSRRARLDALAPAWLLATIMAGLTTMAGLQIPAEHLLLKLLVMIVTGMAIYIALMRLFARDTFRFLLSFTPWARSPSS